MKAPVREDPEDDRKAVQDTYEHSETHADRDLLPGWENLEIQKPRHSDVIGFVVCFAICLLLVGATSWLAGIGVQDEFPEQPNRSRPRRGRSNRMLLP